MDRGTFISVDVEASGPIPGEYSMLSLGACVVGATHEQFYAELTPITRRTDPAALAVTGFDLDDLEARGADPSRAMADFEAWTLEVTPEGHRPIFVAYPVAFDWMFVAYYFHRFLGRNPFGISGLDVTSFVAGMTGRPYAGTRGRDIEAMTGVELPSTHHALEDAIAQAKQFERLIGLAARG